MELFSPTTPAGIHLLSVNAANYIARILKDTGAVITVTGITVSITAVPVGGVDATPSARIGSPTFVGLIATVLFSNGVAGVNYIIEFLFQFSNGTKEPFDCEIAVRTSV